MPPEDTFAKEVSEKRRVASSDKGEVRDLNFAPFQFIYENDGKTICGITKGNLTLKKAPSTVVDPMVRKYHYSHKTTKNRFLSFTVNGDKGFLQLGYGIRPKMKSKLYHRIGEGNFCEFDRMWLSDELPKFSESQVISLLMKFIKHVHPNIKFVITYADGSVGNVGTIYKATNAFILGKVGVDFYILASGERVHPVSMWHRHKTRAWDKMQEIYPGIKHIKNTEFQYRFLYILDKKERREYLKERGKNESCRPLQEK